MSIEIIGQQIRLRGRCGPEEAESLLAALADGAQTVDLTGCEHLHAALVQLLMAAKVPVTGTPAAPVARWIIPLFSDQSA